MKARWCGVQGREWKEPQHSVTFAVSVFCEGTMVMNNWRDQTRDKIRSGDDTNTIITE